MLRGGITGRENGDRSEWTMKIEEDADKEGHRREKTNKEKVKRRNAKKKKEKAEIKEKIENEGQKSRK